eukprot:3680190-Pyramimonas_sp.AAC.1
MQQLLYKRSEQKGGPIRKVDPHASCLACVSLCLKMLLRRLQNQVSGRPDMEYDSLGHVSRPVYLP